MLFKSGDLLQFVLDDPDSRTEIPYTFGYSRYDVTQQEISDSVYLTNCDDGVLIERYAHRFNPVITECTETIELLHEQGYRLDLYKNRPESTIMIIVRQL